MNARDAALEIARRAVLDVDVERAVMASADGRSPDVIVAIGKAAPAMARGALRVVLPPRRLVVVTADGTDAHGLDVLRAAHPFPDARSVAAAEAVLTAVTGASSVLALISGGASSLVCAPRGLTLEEKRALVETLLASGAPITDVNLVRRHLSRIKGGGLARAALPGKTFACVVSDVLIGEGPMRSGDLHDIGSGPASCDPTTVDEARQALSRYAPEWLARVSLETTFPADDPEASAVEGQIVASPFHLAEAAARRGRDMGLVVEVLPPTLDDADGVGTDWAARAASLPQNHVVIRVGEPSVRLPQQHGLGGRAGRVALAAWVQGLPDGVALVCRASDGVDGSSGAAGAVVSGKAPPGAQEALDCYDDGPFLAAHGAAITGGASGTNLLDLHVLMRLR